MKAFTLPKEFKMGSATASAQIEGGDTLNNWYRWCQRGKIKDSSSCFVADDHYNRYIEDIDLMKQMNHEVYRMSIEWSRIEPKRGVYSQEGINHYIDEISYLIKNGIKPMVTLHHFSEPIWFEDMGGWQKDESVDCFISYVKKVVEGLGDKVDEWITINEPNVYLDGVYVKGSFPPGDKGVRKYFRAAKNLIVAHIRAYELIHKYCKGAKVGIANHMAYFDHSEGGLLGKLGKKMLEHSFHNIFLEGMGRGRFLFPLKSGNSKVAPGRYCDFIGVNYYSRHMVKPALNPGMLFTKLEVKKESSYNDMGWEIYPEGLYIVCKRLYNEYKLPIKITENGTCDRADKFRIKFIYDHLYQIMRLIDEGVEIDSYYHWSTLDNFEWADGLKERFGLIHVDYDSQVRTLRKSGEFYSEIIKNKAVTEELIAKYL